MQCSAAPCILTRPRSIRPLLLSLPPHSRLLFSSNEDSFPSLPSCRRGPDQLFPILFFSLQPSSPLSLRRRPPVSRGTFSPLSQPRIPLFLSAIGGKTSVQDLVTVTVVPGIRHNKLHLATDEAATAYGRSRRTTRFLIRPMVSTPPPNICQTPEATTHDTTQSNPHPSSPTFDSLPQPRAPNNSSSSHDTGNNTIETGIPQQSDPTILPTTMEDAPSPQEQVYAHQMPEMARSDSSSASSVDQNSPQIVAPVPVRPRLPSRKSSGTIIVPRESAEAVEPTDVMIEPGDVRAMSPRRTSEDLEALGREARDELRR